MRISQELFEKDPDAFAQQLEAGDVPNYHFPAEMRRVKHLYLAVDVSAYQQLKAELKSVKTRLADAEYAVQREQGCGEPALVSKLRQERDALRQKAADLQARWDTEGVELEKQVQAAQQTIQEINLPIYRY